MRPEYDGLAISQYLNIKTNPYEQRHKWDIIKKANSGSGGSQGDGGGGGGGEGSGVKVPL